MSLKAIELEPEKLDPLDVLPLLELLDDAPEAEVLGTERRVGLEAGKLQRPDQITGAERLDPNVSAVRHRDERAMQQAVARTGAAAPA